MFRPAEHLPGTFKLRLSGPGAHTAKPETIGAALLEAGKIHSMENWNSCSYYRLHNPFERFVSFGGVFRDTALEHGDIISAQFEPSAERGQIEVVDLEQRSTTFNIQYVPPGATEKYVKVLLEKAGIIPTKTVRSRTRQDMWFCATDGNKSDIPHHIAGENLTSKPLPADKTAILVTVPGRRIRCYYCGSSEHWSNKCTKGREVRHRRYADRENERTRLAAE